MNTLSEEKKIDGLKKKKCEKDDGREIVYYEKDEDRGEA